MDGAVAIVLSLLAIPFVLPIISWVMARRLRQRVEDLEQQLSQQGERIDRLSTQLSKLKDLSAEARSAKVEAR